jgi:periodic tryptophan protein 2
LSLLLSHGCSLSKPGTPPIKTDRMKHINPTFLPIIDKNCQLSLETTVVTSPRASEKDAFFKAAFNEGSFIFRPRHRVLSFGNMVAFGYHLANIWGRSFTGGNIIFTPDGASLLSPVGDHIAEFALTAAWSRTLEATSRADLEFLALAPPSGQLLLTVDVDGRAMYIHRSSGAVLHRFRFKGGPVQQLAFAPDGSNLAVGVGPSLQLWRVPQDPAMLPEFAPFVKWRSIAVHADQITALAWSPSGQLLMTGARDHTLRLVHAEGGFPAPIPLRGHRDSVIWTAFGQTDGEAYSLSRDGTLITWRIEGDASLSHRHGQDAERDEAQASAQQKHTCVTTTAQDGNSAGEDIERQGHRKHRMRRDLVRCCNKTNMLVVAGQPRQVRITCASAHPARRYLAAGLSNGVLLLVALDPCPKPGDAVQVLQRFSVSAAPLSSIAIDPSGAWIALASSLTSALIVWEWTSERYVLKQQGHWLDMTCLAYAPRGDVIATGAADGQVKLWSTFTGFCALTLDALHSQGVTGLAFAQRSGVLFSCARDGTVRAIDLKRYRAFRTFVAPSVEASGQSFPFSCVAVDESGDIVAAGSHEPFVVCVWQVRTGQLLETLSGHEAPVSAVCFGGTAAQAEALQLASASWDGTVRLWPLLAGGNRLDAQVLRHSKEVLAMAFHPDGRELVTATTEGILSFWDTRSCTVQATIETRRDCVATGARDALYPSTVCYTPDGYFILAGGGDAHGVLVYSRMTLQCIHRIELVQTFMDAKRPSETNQTESAASPANPSFLHALSRGKPFPFLARRHMQQVFTEDGRVQRRPSRPLRIRGVQVCPTAETWAAATNDGLFLFARTLGAHPAVALSWQGSLGAAFDPIDLAVEVTPANMYQACQQGQWSLALSLALRLNEPGYIYEMLTRVPPTEIDLVVRAIPAVHVPTLLLLLAEALVGSARLPRARHWEYLLRWCTALLVWHGEAASHATLPKEGAAAARQWRPPRNHRFDAALVAVQRAVLHYRETLQRLCDENRFLLRLCLDASLSVTSSVSSQDAESLLSDALMNGESPGKKTRSSST